MSFRFLVERVAQSQPLGMSMHNVLDRWVSVESGPFFELDSSPDWVCRVLPSDYFEVALAYGGREGFLGEDYLRLYRLEELRALNEAYQTSLYRPGLVVFASDGYGEGLAFLGRHPQVLKVPLIPLPVQDESLDVVAADFATFAKEHSARPAKLYPNPETVGLELHLKLPLCMGGRWQDESNQVMVAPAKHAELARYWNRLYREIEKRQKGGSGS